MDDSKSFKKVKLVNKILVCIIALIVFLFLMGILCLYFGYKSSRDLSQNILEGKEWLETCYLPGTVCEMKLGSYFVNEKEYAITTLQYPTSGFAGSVLFINGKSMEIGYSSGLSYIELFNDDFFLVNADKKIYIVDLDLNIIKEYDLGFDNYDLKTLKIDNKYVIQYSVCKDDTLYLNQIDLKELSDSVVIFKQDNVDCIDNIKNNTKYFE